MGLATATCAHCGKQFTAPMHSNHHRTSRRDIARAQVRFSMPSLECRLGTGDSQPERHGLREIVLETRKDANAGGQRPCSVRGGWGLASPSTPVAT